MRNEPSWKSRGRTTAMVIVAALGLTILAGSIAVALEEKGPRLRLTFEDDAAPHHTSSLSGLPAPGNPDPASCIFYNGLQQLAESVVYYRTADRKNRMVVFLT